MRPKGQLFELKRLREDYNLTQKDIAEAVGSSTSFLSAIEHGRRSAPASLLERLENIFHVNNIKDYLKDRHNEEINDISESDKKYIQYNSPQALMFINSQGKETFTKAEVIDILRMQNIENNKLSLELENKKKNEDSETTLYLAIKMLHEANQRLKRAESRISILEQQLSEKQGF
jgi:transcriptional regulator with XRE-family HTH domain